MFVGSCDWVCGVESGLEVEFGLRKGMTRTRVWGSAVGVLAMMMMMKKEAGMKGVEIFVRESRLWEERWVCLVRVACAGGLECWGV